MYLAHVYYGPVKLITQGPCRRTWVWAVAWADNVLCDRYGSSLLFQVETVISYLRERVNNGYDTQGQG